MKTTITAAEVAEVIASIKLPGLYVYAGDWKRDGVAGCSLPARGLWFELMLIMHDAKPYGHLVDGGAVMPDARAARRCGCAPAEYKRALSELHDAGVPRYTGDEDYRSLVGVATLTLKNGDEVDVDLSPLGMDVDGVIYSRRMLKDQRTRVIKKIIGRLGGNPNLVKELVNQNPALTRVHVGARTEKEREEDSPVPIQDELEGVQGEPKTLTPQQQAVGIVLDAFAVELRPHPGLAARWIDQIAEGRNDPDPIAAAEAVREIVWKYPDKSPDYIGKCVGTAAARIRSGEDHVIGRRPPGRKIINFA